MSDHVHLFVGLNPRLSISETIKEKKRSSTLFINSLKVFPEKFYWQEGFGVFSYSRSHIDNFYHYIENQQKHHQKKSFRDEYLEFLVKFEVDFDEQFLFEFFE